MWSYPIYAPSVYFSSITASADLVCAISLAKHCSVPSPSLKLLWLGAQRITHLSHDKMLLPAGNRKVSDGLSVTVSAMSLLETACDAADHTRLLAYMSKESGVWLQALSFCSLGLQIG